MLWAGIAGNLLSDFGADQFDPHNFNVFLLLCGARRSNLVVVVWFKMELLTNSEIVQTNLFQICCLLKNGKKKDAWRRHPIYFIIRFKLIAVAERRQ